MSSTARPLPCDIPRIRVSNSSFAGEWIHFVGFGRRGVGVRYLGCRGMASCRGARAVCVMEDSIRIAGQDAVLLERLANAPLGLAHGGALSVGQGLDLNMIY